MIPCQCGCKQFDQDGNESKCRNCGARMIVPHPAQIKLLRSRASIAIFGGAKGGGKSFSLLLETTRHLSNPNFAAVIFRREGPQIFGPGGLWDTSDKIFPHVGGTSARFRGEWTFPSGARVRFAHLMLERDVNSWDGQQVPMIGFDELTLFTEKQFWYMLTINRSTCGVTPYIRASCNPDADSWVAQLLTWWIDQETGLPIPDRSGKLRWFVREGGQLVWADSRQELVQKFPRQVPKSLTFIPAKLEDNPTLDLGDPGYRANLLSQEVVIRQRLLEGNWKVRPAAGLKFPHHKWRLYEEAPEGMQLYCRFWDKAATAGGKGARTAGVLMGMLDDKRVRELGLPKFWVLNVVADRWGDAEREARIRSTAELDRATYGSVAIGLEQEPGSGGKHSAYVTVSGLAGYHVYAERAETNKSARWTPIASQQQAGNVGMVQGDWDWSGAIRELDALAGDARTSYGDHENLDKGKLKDIADAMSGAFKYLVEGGKGGRIEGDINASDPGDDFDEPITDEERQEFDPDLLELIEGANEAIGESLRDW